MIFCASGAGPNKELIEKRKEESGLAVDSCTTERKTDRQTGRMERRG